MTDTGNYFATLFSWPNMAVIRKWGMWITFLLHNGGEWDKMGTCGRKWEA
jgi:hypothetical protein